MIRRILFVFTLLFLANLTFAQQGWQKSYPYTCGSTPCITSIVDVEPTFDGGYIALEDVRTDAALPHGGHGLPNGFVNVLRLNKDGNLLWRKPLVQNNTNAIKGISIEPTPDNGYIISAIEFPYPQVNSTQFGVKLDANGDFVWREDFTTTQVPGSNSLNVIVTSDSNYVFAFIDQQQFPHFTQIRKYSPSGQIIWDKPLSLPSNAFRLASLANGDFLMATGNQLVTFDSAGNIITSYATSRAQKVIQTHDNGFLTIKSEDFYSNDIEKYSATGTLEWDVDLTTPPPFFYTFINDLSMMGDSNYAVIHDDTTFHYVLKFDTLGNQLWQKSMMSFSLPDDELNAICLNNDGLNVVGGSYYGRSTLWKIDKNGNTTSILLEGNVYQDDNNNCLLDGNEPALRRRVIRVNQNGSIYHQITDSLGNYAINLDTGTAIVSVFTPYNPNLWQSCTPTQSVYFANLGDTLSADFGLQPLATCPSLVVDISTPLLRQCCPSTYTVNYCNLGSQDAQNTYVEVDLDPYIIFTSSSIPSSNQMGQTYTFPVGNVPMGQCGQFTIDVVLDTFNVVLGQTHCTEAHIFPDTVCAPTPNWNGAEVEVNGECLVDSVRFTIKNIGTADMSQSKEYFVIEDHVIMLQNTYQLNQNDSTIVTVPTTGGTYRVLAEQEDGHPYSTLPTAAVEGCTALPIFSLGYINDFPFDDAAPFLSVSCIENIGSYDPNDKAGTPNGWEEQHFILPNTTIDYKIRFQNTGTDTAFNVVILDTIDTQVLDLTTVQFGASSHSYEAEIVDQHVLKFTFENIMLPDSNVNEPASNGFVKFKIAQQSNNPIGSLIENSAAIYFDFNLPIITNTAFHTVGQMPFFVKTDDLQDVPQAVKLDVFPNPFFEQVTFKFSDEQPRNFSFTLVDVTGRTVYQEAFSQKSQFQFYRNGLANGLYFYTIIENGQLIGQGKIVTQ